MKKRWIALYSQTGEELYNLSLNLRRFPDLVLCNNPDSLRAPFYELLSEQTKVKLMPHADIEKFIQYCTYRDDIITLNGYLRILSEDCLRTEAEILNGHPGNILDYPELRGKDPQQRVIDNMGNYKSIGCVIHRVTAEVDAGAPVAFEKRKFIRETATGEWIFRTLRDMMLDMWEDTMRERLEI